MTIKYILDYLISFREPHKALYTYIKLIGGIYMFRKFNEKIEVVECLSGFRLSRMEKFNLFMVFIFNL